jgi:hypothetical protein
MPHSRQFDDWAHDQAEALLHFAPALDGQDASPIQALTHQPPTA